MEREIVPRQLVATRYMRPTHETYAGAMFSRAYQLRTGEGPDSLKFKYRLEFRLLSTPITVEVAAVNISAIEETDCLPAEAVTWGVRRR